MNIFVKKHAYLTNFLSFHFSEIFSPMKIITETATPNKSIMWCWTTWFASTSLKLESLLFSIVIQICFFNRAKWPLYIIMSKLKWNEMAKENKIRVNVSPSLAFNTYWWLSASVYGFLLLTATLIITESKGFSKDRILQPK